MQPFVSALGTAYDLTSKEIADIIWLALQMQNSDETVEAATSLEPSTAAETADDRSRPSPENFTPPTDSDDQPDRSSQTKSAEVHLNQASFGKQLALKVPDARSLREPLSLARSLKPLLRRVVTGWSTVLDEAATVDRIAAEQLWLPVLKPALEPWLDLALVVDESASMQLWQRTIAELQRLLSHYGVFRDVRVWGLVTDAQGQVQLRPGLSAAARRQAARRPSELLDPSGRRLILVATDCVSSGWQDGSLLPALKLWATSGPLAIVQMLPEWLWSRTGLGFASAVRLQALLPGVPNQQLIAKDLSPWDEVDLEAGLKVPVVTLEPEPFAAWTEMMMGKGGAWSPGFVFEPEIVTSNGQVAQLSEVATEDSAEQRVQRFRVTASPMARRLAGLLAAAPVISLPVVRIIQDRLLSESRQVHVAEVFLGGLLKPLEDVESEVNPDMMQYNFWDGVREILLQSVPTNDSVDVLQEVSQFVAERLGLSLNAFAAVLRNPKQIEDRELANQSRPFAMVTAQILRQLGREYARFAEELEEEFGTSFHKAKTLRDFHIPQETMLGDIHFWRPVYQLFKPDAPLSKPEDLRDFYVARDGNPVRRLISSLAMSDVPEKILLAGHRGSGKTTELRKLQQQLEVDYTVIWVDADAALDRYNVGYAEVMVLIGLKIFETVMQTGWKPPQKLQQDLVESLKTVIYQDKDTASGTLELPKFFQEASVALRVGLQQNTTKALNIRPALTEIISKMNAIVKAAEAEKEQKLLVIVDGLDRRNHGTTQEIFSSPLLTDLSCHVIYSISNAFQYFNEGKAALEMFDKYLNLLNPPVFKCNEQRYPTTEPDKVGRHVLQSVIQKRLAKLSNHYSRLFQPEALELLCEKSGGVMRDLIWLVRTTCEVALERKISFVDLNAAEAAVQENRKTHSIQDYHYPVLQIVHQTGRQTNTTYGSSADRVSIFDQLLQNKLVLEYEDPRLGNWFDVSPILLEDLERWQATNQSET